MFHLIEGAQVILQSKGVYRQVPLYSRKGRVYAKWGTGFIGLCQHFNGTTIPNVRWDEVFDLEYCFNSVGYMLVRDDNVRSLARSA